MARALPSYHVSKPASQPLKRTVLSSVGRSWVGIDAEIVHISQGKLEVPSSDSHLLGMHFGPPVTAFCSCGTTQLRRVQRPGDFSFLPAGMPGLWDDEGDCQILRLSLHPALLDQAARDLGQQSSEVRLPPRLELRDAGLEAIGRAIKADLEAPTPSNPAYIAFLARALAVRLIETSNGKLRQEEDRKPKFSERRLRRLTDYIETHLDTPLHLPDLAGVAEVSVTRLKILFRNSMGITVRQYVISRRVEYARSLIATTAMPASEVALAAGFSHQSHMANTMRRILGHTPGEIARSALKN